MEQVAGVVLAAGSARRMGQPKQLLDWHGEPLIRHAASTALAAGLAPLIVVTGAAGEAVAAALAGLPVQCIANQRHTEGQSTSLRCGVEALPPEAGAVAVLLGDQPFVEAAHIAALVAAWRSSQAAIVAPVFAGQRGNPVIFARSVFPELLRISGDQGARAVIAADPARVAFVAFDDAAPLADIDTPETYRQLHQERP